MSLTGKTIIVTGAASGIGKETAAELSRQGAVVIGLDRDPADGVHEHYRADFGDPGSIDRVVRELPDGADGLCNIAGVPPTAPADEVVRVNAKGLQYFTEHMVPKLAEGASIVNLASLSGIGWRNSIDQIKEFATLDFDEVETFVDRHNMDEGARSYFFSKEYIVVWTMQRRWTWRERGIRMNAVSPGPVETPILPDFLEAMQERAALAKRVMDRYGRPTDVAPVVAFLLSDQAAWFRGANLTPDGGMSSHITLHEYGIE